MDPLYTIHKGDPDALLGRALIVPDDAEEDNESLMVSYTAAGMRSLLSSSNNTDFTDSAVEFKTDIYSPTGHLLFGDGYDLGDSLGGIDGDILVAPAALNDAQNTLRLSAAARHYLDTFLSQRLPPFYILVSDLRAAIESREGYSELLINLGSFSDLFHFPEDLQNLQKLPELSRYRSRFQLMSLLLDNVVAEIGDDQPAAYRAFGRLSRYSLTKKSARKNLRHLPVKRSTKKGAD